MITRRGMLFGLLAAPAIIRTPGLLMPVKALEIPDHMMHLQPYQQAVVDAILPPGTYTCRMLDRCSIDKSGHLTMHLMFDVASPIQRQIKGTFRL